MNRNTLVAIATLLTAACGGGGGGGDDNDPTSTYTGSTAAATITTGSDAVTLANTVMAAAQSQVEQVQEMAGGMVAAPRRVALVPISDGCGGSVDENEVDNGTSGTYTAVFDDFHPNCPDTSMVLDGYLRVDWSDTASYLRHAVTLDPLSLTFGGHVFLYDGQFVWDDYHDGHDVFTANFEAALDGQGIYKAENFTMVADAGGMRTVEGRYYYGPAGYIDIDTTTNFAWGCADGGPSDGVMTVTASGGAAWTFDFGYGTCNVVAVTGPDTNVTYYNWDDGTEILTP